MNDLRRRRDEWLCEHFPYYRYAMEVGGENFKIRLSPFVEHLAEDRSPEFIAEDGLDSNFLAEYIAEKEGGDIFAIERDLASFFINIDNERLNAWYSAWEFDHKEIDKSPQEKDARIDQESSRSGKGAGKVSKLLSCFNAVLSLIMLPISIFMQILAVPVGLLLAILPAEFLVLGYFCLPLFCNGRADDVMTCFFGIVSITILAALDVYVTCLILGAMWIIFAMAVLDKIMYVSFFIFSIYCFISGSWIWGLLSILFIPSLLSVCNDKIMLAISRRENILKCFWSIPTGMAIFYLARDVFECEWLHILTLIATLLPWGAMIYASPKTHD